ncbi:hypothetical protein HK096_002362 [Nowakowskiella sp. JEL0078]|nr:hypothetical protein HK096_002362 [Nowakowskiella sp. JEL0078]
MTNQKFQKVAIFLFESSQRPQTPETDFFKDFLSVPQSFLRTSIRNKCEANCVRQIGEIAETLEMLFEKLGDNVLKVKVIADSIFEIQSISLSGTCGPIPVIGRDQHNLKLLPQLYEESKIMETTFKKTTEELEILVTTLISLGTECSRYSEINHCLGLDLMKNHTVANLALEKMVLSDVERILASRCKLCSQLDHLEFLKSESWDTMIEAFRRVRRAEILCVKDFPQDLQCSKAQDRSYTLKHLRETSPSDESTNGCTPKRHQNSLSLFKRSLISVSSTELDNISHVNIPNFEEDGGCDHLSENGKLSQVEDDQDQFQPTDYLDIDRNFSPLGLKYNPTTPTSLSYSMKVNLSSDNSNSNQLVIAHEVLMEKENNDSKETSQQPMENLNFETSEQMLLVESEANCTEFSIISNVHQTTLSFCQVSDDPIPLKKSESLSQLLFRHSSSHDSIQDSKYMKDFEKGFCEITPALAKDI